MASSCPPPLGIRLGAHAAQPAPEADGKVRGRGSHVLLIQALGWSGGHTRSGEPTSSLVFLLVVELVALTKEQLVFPPPSVCTISPQNSVCVNSILRFVPSWQTFLLLGEEDALTEREGFGSRGISFTHSHCYRKF